MKRSAIVMASAVLALCLGGNGTVAGDKPNDAQSKPPKEIDYAVESSIGVAHLTVRPATASVLFWIDDTPGKVVPIAIQATLAGSLLGKFVSEHGTPARLFVVFKDTAELFKRLGEAALEAAEWNAMTGQPRNRTVSRFVVDEINAEHLTRELDDSFASAGYELKAESAEEIIVGSLRGGNATAVPISGVVGFIATRVAPQ